MTSNGIGEELGSYPQLTDGWVGTEWKVCAMGCGILVLGDVL